MEIIESDTARIQEIMYKDHEVVAYVRIERTRCPGHELGREQGFLLQNVGSEKPEGRQTTRKTQAQT